jgi:hypothetical protein
MRSLVSLLVLFSAAAAWGGETKLPATGKVVAVENDGSLWIYMPDVCASYHILLTGATAPASDQSLDKAAHTSLVQMVLGQEVLVSADRLNTVGPTRGEVFLQGRSVNTQLASLMAGAGAAKPEPPASRAPARRPLLAFCAQIRARLPWRN